MTRILLIMTAGAIGLLGAVSVSADSGDDADHCDTVRVEEDCNDEGHSLSPLQVRLLRLGGLPGWTGPRPAAVAPPPPPEPEVIVPAPSTTTKGERRAARMARLLRLGGLPGLR